MCVCVAMLQGNLPTVQLIACMILVWVITWVTVVFRINHTSNALRKEVRRSAISILIMCITSA